MKKDFKKLIEYHAEGHTYKLINRTGDAAIFEQLRNGVAVAYEVIIIRRNSKMEYPPSTEEWGKYGWTFGLLNRAEKELEGLCKTKGYSI